LKDLMFLLRRSDFSKFSRLNDTDPLFLQANFEKKLD